MRRLAAIGITVALFATSCGSSSDSSTPDPTSAPDSATTVEGSQAPTASDDFSTVVSDDGLVTLVQSGEAIPITIEAVDELEELDSEFTPLLAYEFGPDGTEFSSPVQVRVAVTDEQLRAGLVAVLTSSDGTIEPLELSVEEQGDSLFVIAEINHFSRLDVQRLKNTKGYIDLPEKMYVGDTAPRHLIGKNSEIETTVEDDANIAGSGDPKDWKYFAPLAAAGPDSVTCVDKGLGGAEFDGLVNLEFDAFNGVFPKNTRGVGRITDSAEVLCLEKVVVEIIEQDCWDMSAGLATDGCAFPGPIELSGPHPTTFHIELPGLTESPDSAFSIFMNADEANPTLIELYSDGRFNGYDGLGFLPFTPGSEISGGVPVQTADGYSHDFETNFTVDDAGALIIALEGDEAAGVEAGQRVVTDITIFVRVGDKQSASMLNISDIIGLFE